jgi:small lipoprotein (TIGR04452 family)
MKKFKIIAIALVLLTFSTSCLLTNPAGLSSNRESGADASSRIVNAAITADAIYFTMRFGTPYFSILAFLADDIAGINDSAYYKKTDVDDGVTGFLFGSLLANVLKCNLQPADGILIGDPLPKI